MDAPADNLNTYRELADVYERNGQNSERDHCLILAAYSALEAGHAAEAERLRQRLLQNSRNHQLRAYASFERAVPYIKELLDDLLQMYRSEERRVGKECRSRWSPDQQNNKQEWKTLHN